MAIDHSGCIIVENVTIAVIVRVSDIEHGVEVAILERVGRTIEGRGHRAGIQATLARWIVSNIRGSEAERTTENRVVDHPIVQPDDGAPLVGTEAVVGLATFLA